MPETLRPRMFPQNMTDKQSKDSSLGQPARQGNLCKPEMQRLRTVQRHKLGRLCLRQSLDPPVQKDSQYMTRNQWQRTALPHMRHIQ